jgi:signal transduction histidine kinase
MTGALTSTPYTPLGETEGRILAEQVRLLMGNVGSSVIPAFVLALLILWTLGNPANAAVLRAWCAAVCLSKLICYLHARHHHGSGTAPGRLRRLVGEMLVLNAVDGALWGALGWAVLGSTTLAGQVLVASVVTGITASSMSLLSPVLPVFIVFAVAEYLAFGSKVFMLGDPAYSSLGVAGLFYIATLIGQARNSARAARSAVQLGFEKTELVEQLIAEKAIAERARHAAEEANAAKTKFLAAASHDLRQPIHAQGLFLEVLARTPLTPQQHELLASVSAAGHASAEMLNTLLDFSRIEAGVIEPQIQAFAIQPLLNKIEREFERQANERGLAYRSRETELVVHSDPTLIELILRNLVSNAIRYTERGGLLVGCRRRGGQVLLEVWDTGIGIEPSQQREVFREFHQLGNPERDRRKGLGLGLAIVSGLVRTLGHELTLDSTVQRGTVFRLSMPLATAASPWIPLVEESHTVRALQVRVLLIDDDEAVRESMLHLLKIWGCTCDVAESLEEALTLARARAPDVIISDYRLREQRTGIEAISTLRSVLGDTLPALLITGDTSPMRLRDAFASGIPLLHKPVSPTQLHQGLDAIVKQTAGC